MSELDAFKNAILVRRVAARAKQGMEFPTEKALKDYLREHPDADKSKHTVRKSEPKKDNGSDKPESSWPSEKEKKFEKAFEDYKSDLPYLKEIADAISKINKSGPNKDSYADEKVRKDLKGKLDKKLKGMTFSDAWEWVSEEAEKSYMKQENVKKPKLPRWQDIIEDGFVDHGPRDEGQAAREKRKEKHEEIDREFERKGDYGRAAIMKRELDHREVEED